MALDNTYAGLKASVAGMMDVTATDITGVIADIVTLGENRIFREAKTKDNEASISTSISAGVVAVPSDYMSLKFAYIDGTPVQTLERRSAQWIYSAYSTRSANGRPKYVARDSTNFIFGPYPDSGYTFKGAYYKRAGTLSTAVYDLFTNNQDLYLFACLAESEIVIGRDARLPIWEAKYKNILNDVNGLDKMEALSGSPLQMRLG